MVVEVMGRHAGWIAAYAGLAAGADAILVPEWPYDTDEVCDLLRARHANGTTYSIVVVSEGAKPKDATGDRRRRQTDAFGHARLGGVAVALSAEIEERTGYETRYTILGHVQRGGTPTAFDRVLATRFGVAAMDAVVEGRFGEMVALRAGRSCSFRSPRRCASRSCSTHACSTWRRSSSAERPSPERPSATVWVRECERTILRSGHERAG